MLHPEPSNIATIVARSRPYLEQMVDSEGLPYFNAFYSTPTLMAHDWPDFGDVMSRQYQAAIMYRHMTGTALATEQVWQQKILALLSPDDGLLYRPATSFSQHVADPGDQALTLYALATACLDDPSDQMRQAVAGMVRGIQARMDTPAYQSGFLLKSLLVAWRVLQDTATWALIEQLVQLLLANPGPFPPDDIYPPHTHVHGTLRTLCGIVDYARFVDDRALIARAERLGRFIRERGTSFGFLPESVDRPSDIISCETCALMDYVGLAVSLANAGYVEYWSEVERVVRNQLTESQAHDLDWLTVDDQRPDTPQFSWRDLSARLVGSYAGWSSPTHFLAAEETLNAHWGGPELRDKPRLLQNCCGGSGVHAFFIAWKNIARYQDGHLTVALHMDKSIPQAEIRCQQPYQGLLSVRLLCDCSVSLRLPDWVAADEVRLTCNGQEVPFALDRPFLRLGSQPAHSLVEMRYPLAQRTEQVSIGNPGYQRYPYQVTWKGDTVIDVRPIGDAPQTGWSNYDKKPVRVYYGEQGPGRLYQRQGYLASEAPLPGTLYQDTSSLDLW